MNQSLEILPAGNPQARKLKRHFYSSAAECDVDKQGRILVPADLREHAELIKDVMVIGASNRMEIWDAARWQTNDSTFTNEMIAEAMDQLGF